MTAEPRLAPQRQPSHHERTEKPPRLRQEYATRRVEPLETWSIDGWTLKIYGIAFQRSAPRAELVAEAKRAARETLPPPDSPGVYGIGFIIVHDGQDGGRALVDWWTEGEILFQRLFGRAHDNEPLMLRYDGALACVWELPILAFERDHWVRDVLSHPDAPEVDRYLSRTLSADV